MTGAFPDLRVERLAVGPFQANCYLLHDVESNEGAVIAPVFLML